MRIKIPHDCFMSEAVSNAYKITATCIETIALRLITINLLCAVHAPSSINGRISSKKSNCFMKIVLIQRNPIDCFMKIVMECLVLRNVLTRYADFATKGLSYTLLPLGM